MNCSNDKQRAIELTRAMKAADTRCRAAFGPNTEDHGEWANYDKTPRGGTKWTPGVFEKLERVMLFVKSAGPLGVDRFALVAWEMGRSSDAVFQAMRKAGRSDLLKHLSLEI